MAFDSYVIFTERKQLSLLIHNSVWVAIKGNEKHAFQLKPELLLEKKCFIICFRKNLLTLWVQASEAYIIRNG